MDASERKTRIAWLRPWVASCAAILHLDHWTVTVGDEPAEDGAQAQISRWRGQLDVTIRFGDHFLDAPQDEQQRVVAYELLHAHLRPVWEVWYDLDEVLGKPAYVLLRNHAQIAEEQVVEALARVIAPLLPLPPGETKAGSEAS